MTLPDAALHQHIAIVGRTGSGKSYAARGFVERLLEAGSRCCIVDPTGSWYGLRSSADGEAPGFPVVVFGGDHGDVEISDSMGEALGGLVAGAGLSSVIDLSGFGVGEMRRFVSGFAGALYHHLRAPLHLVIDEADEFAPQRIGPDQTAMFSRIDRIVRRGRNRGFRVTMISQRPAVLNKDILSQAATLIAMKLTAPQDRAALSSWIEGQADRDRGREVIDSLPRLQLGEGWIWWPEGELLERVRFPAIRTFDSSRTPGAGETVVEPVALASVDLAGIRAKLAAVDADEPQQRRGKPDAAAIEQARQQGYQEGRLAAWRRAADDLHRLEDEVAAAIRAVHKRWSDELVADWSKDPPAAVPTFLRRKADQTRDRRSDPTPIGAGASLHAAARAMLAELVAIHPAPVTWSTVATLAGLKARGGHFNAGRKALIDSGLIVVIADLVAAGAAALDLFGTERPEPKTPAELLEMWRQRLPAPAPEMLSKLAEHPAGLPRDRLAELLGKKPVGGHWNSGAKILRDAGLIEVSGNCWRLSAPLRGEELRA